MKIIFNSDDKKKKKKVLKIHILTVIVKCVFKKNGKSYLQVFLDDCLYDL